jgi:hypothetical protein
MFLDRVANVQHPRAARKDAIRVFVSRRCVGMRAWAFVDRVEEFGWLGLDNEGHPLWTAGSTR